jgi:multiple sugar transport system ATP-binding protein
MRKEINELHLKLNATMIYVTHDQVEAMTMATKIVVMKDGKVQQIGAPLTLYNHPINKFVAGFIGSPAMNFLSAKVLEEGGAIVLQEEGFKIKPVKEHADALKKYVGKEVFFGIRPEDLLYTDNASVENNMELKISVIEPLGADIHLWLNAGTQPLVARTEAHHVFKVGQTVNFTPRLEKARYFDKETELSVLDAAVETKGTPKK